jgi:hypothetical protein
MSASVKGLDGSRRSSVKQILGGSDHPAATSEKQVLEGALNEALVQSMPQGQGQRPGSRSAMSRKSNVGMSSRTNMQPSTKSDAAPVRRMSTMEIRNADSHSENTKDLSETSNQGSGMLPPIGQVGPVALLDDMSEPPPQKTSASRRRMSAVGSVLPALHDKPVVKPAVSPDVYDALVSAARDAGGSKKSKKSFKAVASTVKMAGKYSGMLY